MPQATKDKLREIALAEREIRSERAKRQWADPDIAAQMRKGLIHRKKAKHTRNMSPDQYKQYRQLLGHKYHPHEALRIMGLENVNA